MSLAAPRGQFHSQTLALRPFGADDDDGIHRSIVAGTWILDNLDSSDHVRLDVFQFLQVAQFAVVQINERCALA